jgi:hypothetical protein
MTTITPAKEFRATWVAMRCSIVALPRFMEKANFDTSSVHRRRINQTNTSIAASGRMRFKA